MLVVVDVSIGSAACDKVSSNPRGLSVEFVAPMVYK